MEGDFFDHLARAAEEEQDGLTFAEKVKLAVGIKLMVTGVSLVPDDALEGIYSRLMAEAVPQVLGGSSDGE